MLKHSIVAQQMGHAVHKSWICDVDDSLVETKRRLQLQALQHCWRPARADRPSCQASARILIGCGSRNGALQMVRLEPNGSRRLEVRDQRLAAYPFIYLFSIYFFRRLETCSVQMQRRSAACKMNGACEQAEARTFRPYSSQMLEPGYAQEWQPQRPLASPA